MDDEYIERLYVSIGSDISDLLKGVKKGVTEVEKDLESMAKKSESRFKRLGNSIKGLFKRLTKTVAVASAAITAAALVVKKLTDAAVELDKSLVNLAISSAAANREFGKSVGTSESWKNTIKDLRAELRIYSERELANASSRLIDMSKRLGLTEQQMVTLLRRTADLSAGKVDLEGGIERVTAAMRGEAESAEYLGLSLNENAVRAYAEAHGLVWKELDEAEKAQQRYALFLEQTNQLQGRAAVYAETLAGKEQTLAAALEDQQALLGEQLMPLREGYVELLKTMASETEGSSSVITNALAALAASFLTLGITIKVEIDGIVERFTALGNIVSKTKDAILAGENIGEAIAGDVEMLKKANEKQIAAITQIGATWQASFDQIREGWRQQREDQKKAADEMAGLEMPPPLDPDKVKENLAKISGMLDKYAAELLDLQENLAEQSEQLERDHADKVASIREEYADARLEAQEELNDAILDAEKSRNKAIADLEKDLAKQRRDIIEQARQDLAALEAETDEALADQQEDFDREELRRTEDHLADLRRIRQQYLESIEDAVKNRDARALVDARRRFRQEQQETETNFQTESSRRGEDQNLRLQEIRDQEQRRAEEILASQERELNRLKEYERERRSEIENSFVEQLASAERNYTNQMEKEQEHFAAQMEKEQENFKAREEELDNAMAERLETIAKALADEEEINEQEAQRILETLSKYFGVDGEIDRLMEDFARRRQQKIEIQVAFTGGKAPSLPSVGGGGFAPQPIPSFQHGGTMIANRPTLVQFGEVPELAQFTPLARMNNTGGQGMPQEMTIKHEFSGSAPPGIRSTERDQIASVLVNAFREAGFSRK